MFAHLDTLRNAFKTSSVNKKDFNNHTQPGKRSIPVELLYENVVREAKLLKKDRELKKRSEIYISPYLDSQKYTREKMLAVQKEKYNSAWMHREVFKTITND
jgi:hypothetical protein